MGFGLLLCGYFILTLMPVGMGDYSFACYVIGGLISLKATWSLKDYCPKFSLASLASLLYILLGVYYGVAYLDMLFAWGLVPVGNAADNVLQAVGYALELGYHVFILLAVIDLTGELDMLKRKSRAVTNLVFAIIWGVGQLVLVIFPSLLAIQAGFIPKILLLWALICYVLNVFLLHSCYQNICPAGEEFGKEAKPSRFAFVNRLNQKFEEKSAKALQESLDYQAEKQKRREERKKNKKKKK